MGVSPSLPGDDGPKNPSHTDSSDDFSVTSLPEGVTSEDIIMHAVGMGQPSTLDAQQPSLLCDIEDIVMPMGVGVGEQRATDPLTSTNHSPM